MTRIEWNDALLIGVKEIDEQHHKLIEIANDLLESLRGGTDKQAQRKAVRDLRDYTVSHFRQEEAYMASLRYPDLDKHRTAHRQLTGLVKTLQDDLYRTERLDPETVRDLLQRWLLTHILRVDTLLARFAREKGAGDTASIPAQDDASAVPADAAKPS